MLQRSFLCFILCFPFFAGLQAQSQYATNGNAVSQANNCFRLTQALTGQTGSVWYLNRVDISKPFDLYFDIFLGCSNNGADGMAFVLQSVSTSVGSNGGGLGYQGITPSFAVEFDTYRNGNMGDPVADHMAIMANGNPFHNNATTNLAGPVSMKTNNANVEDCNFHKVRITWDTANYTFRVYFDCVLRLTYTGNIAQNFFNNNPLVFWGFTAATGALTNEHRFCLDYVSFVEELQDTTICQGDTVPLSVGTGASFAWTPAVGLSDSSIANPRAFPDTTTTYIATVTDGCMQTRVDSVTITVGDTTQLSLDLGADTTLCTGDSLILDRSRPGVTYAWQNGSTQPADTARTAGTYWLELTNACGTNRDSIDIDYEAFPQVNLGQDTTFCNPNPWQLNATFASQTPIGTQYLWQDGSNLPTFNASSTGVYWAEVSNYCGTERDSINLTFTQAPTPFSLGPDTLLCPGDSLLLNGAQPGVSYLWQNGSVDSSFLVTSPGQYSLRLDNYCGTERDSIQVNFLMPPAVNLRPDTILCRPDSLVIDAGNWPLVSYQWQDGSSGRFFTVQDTGWYKVVVTNLCGAVSEDSQYIDYEVLPQIDLGNDTTLCPGESHTLDLSASNATFYQWLNGPAQATQTVSAAGTYIGWAGNQCGVDRDTFVVQTELLPQLELGNDTLLCNEETLRLDIAQPGYSYLWEDGSTDSVRIITSPGLYKVLVSNFCGQVQDSIRVRYESSPIAINLGEDTSICRGDWITLTAPGNNVSFRWSGGSTDPSLTVSQGGLYWVETYNVCGSERDSIFISLDQAPTVDLGPDLLKCIGESHTLDAFLDRARYLWQDGSTQPAYTVTQSGTYSVAVTNACGTSYDTVQAIFDNLPLPFDLGDNQTFCVGDSFPLDGSQVASLTAPIDYTWQDGEKDSIRWVGESGLYVLRLSNRCGIRRDSVYMTFVLPPEPDLGGDTLRCADQNESLFFDVTYQGATYLWQNGSRMPFMRADREGIYRVEVTNECGTVADSMFVRDSDCSCTIHAPTGFTPNGDGYNDHFQLFYDCELTLVDWRIYDRWGRVVFQAESLDDLWAGKSPQGGDVPEGVYVWVLYYHGYLNKHEVKETRKGTVTLFR